MRSFSFPLYPYPRYRTPSSDGWTTILGQKIHDEPFADETKSTDSWGPSAAATYSAEPESLSSTENAAQMRYTGQYVAGLATIVERLQDIDQEVTRCEENMNTLLILDGVLFTGFLVLLAKGLSLAAGLTDTARWISQSTTEVYAIAFWSAAIVLLTLVARLCVHVKRCLQKSQLLDPRLEPLSTRFNVRLFRPSELHKSMAFEFASVSPILLHLALVFFLVGSYVHFVPPSVTNIIQPFVAASCLTTIILYVFHTTSCPSPLRIGLQVLAPAIVRVVLSLNRSLQGSYVASMGSMEVETNEKAQTMDDDSVAVLDDEAFPDEDILKILIAADDILVDDELVATTMVPTLLRTASSPPSAIYFVLKMLEHRLPGFHFAREHKDSPGMLDLRGLSQHAWVVVVDIVAGVVDRHVGTIGEEQERPPAFVSPWVKTSMSILFSHSDYSLTRKAQQVVSNLTSPQCIDFTCRHVIKRTQSFADIWSGFSRVLPSHEHAHVLHHILKRRFSTDDFAHSSLSEWMAHPHTDVRWHIKDTFDALAGVVHQHIPKQPHNAWHPPAEELLLVMLRWAQRASSAEEEENMSRPIFTLLRRQEEIFASNALSPQVAMEFLQFLTRCTIMQYGFEKSDISGRRSILRNIAAMLERYASGELDKCPGFVDIDMMMLCRRPHWMIEETAEDSYKNWNEWQALLRVLARCLQKWLRDGRAQDGGVTAVPKTAGYCLDTISRLTTRPPVGWTALGLAFPAELIEVLHLFLRPDEYEGACTREECRLRCLSGSGAVPFERSTRISMTHCGFDLGSDEQDEEATLVSFR